MSQLHNPTPPTRGDREAQGQDSGSPAPRRSRDPFAALPHRIAGNPKISPVAKAVLLSLLYWARDKDVCWPSDASIGLRVGRSVTTIKRALRQLESFGLIVRQKSTNNRTGRLIQLAWRSTTDGPSPRPPMVDPPRPRMVDEGDVTVKAKAPKEINRASLPRQRRRPESPPTHPLSSSQPAAPQQTARATAAPQFAPPPVKEPAPAPPEPPPPARPLPQPIAGVLLTAEQQARLQTLPPTVRERVLTWLATGDRILVAEANRLLTPPPPPVEAPRTTAELLARIREDPKFPAMAAQVLSTEFQDFKSWSGYLRLCQKVWQGDLSAEDLVDAYHEASGPRIRNPGALMQHVLSHRPRASG